MPDANILDQVEGQWQKLCLLLLWKVKGREKVNVSHQDILDFQEVFKSEGGAALLTHGHRDSITYQCISQVEMHILAAKHPDGNVKKREI